MNLEATMPQTFELDTDLITQVSAAIRAGEWPRQVLIRLGVVGRVADDWLRLAAEAQQEGRDPDTDVYAHLQRAIETAEADCEADWLEHCLIAARDGKRTAQFTGWMTLLERRFPDRYCVRGAQNRRRSGSDEETLEQALERLKQQQ